MQTLSKLTGQQSQKKSRPVVYWAVDLKLDDVMSHPQIKEHLETHPELKPLQKIHSTLLFIGKRKPAPVVESSRDLTTEDLATQVESLTITVPKEQDENTYIEMDGKECTVMVSGFGHSDKALALQVESIKLSESGIIVPSNAVKQHVTVALAQGTAAKDSVKTLQGEGSIVHFKSTLVLTGYVRGFHF